METAKKILVIEKNLEIRQVILRFLDGLAEFEMAFHAEEARVMYQAGKFDLVIYDYPRNSDGEFLGQLVTDGQAVLLIAALEVEGWKGEFVFKPFKRLDLRNRVVHLFGE